MIRVAVGFARAVASPRFGLMTASGERTGKTSVAVMNGDHWPIAAATRKPAPRKIGSLSVDSRATPNARSPLETPTNVAPATRTDIQVSGAIATSAGNG